MSDTAINEEIVYQLVFAGQSWFAATSLGLKTSSDQGASWQSAYESLQVGATALPTMALAAALMPDETRLVYAGLNEALLRSHDGGKTWQRLTHPSPAPLFSCLAFSPDFAQDGRMYAGTLGDGVIIYSQGGQRWANWNFGLMDFNILCLAASPLKNDADEQTLFVGVQSGIFRSQTSGRSWQELALPCGYEPVLSLALSPDYPNDGVILAGTESQGLYRSNDSGAAWELAGNFSEAINALAFRTSTEVFALHGTSLVHSLDGGATWQVWKPDLLAGVEVSAFAISPAGDALLIGLLGGEIRLENI